MANLSAAEMLKAEMMSAMPVNRAAREKQLAQLRAAQKDQEKAELQAKLQAQQAQTEPQQAPQKPVLERDPPPHLDTVLAKRAQVEAELSALVKGDGGTAEKEDPSVPPVASPINGTSAEVKSDDPATLFSESLQGSEEPEVPTIAPEANPLNEDEPIEGEGDNLGEPMDEVTTSPTGVKRKYEELDEDAEGEEDNEISLGDDVEEEYDDLKLIKNSDGSIWQEDTVR